MANQFIILLQVHIHSIFLFQNSYEAPQFEISEFYLQKGIIIHVV